MSELTCLRCGTELDYDADACPDCGEKVTGFQRTYAGKLIDGKYQILQRLGVGGMGEIFKVRHIHLNEQRVIKIMRANIASDEQSLQRFLHEARLATMIKHRNLAMLYDFSTLDDGSYYMVWEFIEGTNIQKWIAENGPMPPRLATEIAIQALSGLEAIHQMGIIHRDISPENIMLSQDQMGRLLVKVIDFGIAKQLDDGQGGQGLTQTGMFLGKLKYASPEQAGFIREGETLDARSDLYSFGVVFYEMLAGRAPFLATNPHGYILKHATEKPAPIKETTPGVDIPPNLEAIVFRSLEKDRDTRHATTGDFIADLESIRNNIVPDQKFGVGQGMMTLSSRPTAIDTSRPTISGRTTAGTTPGTRPGTGPSPTARTMTPSRPTNIPPTRPASGDATIVESRPTSAASSDATIVEQRLDPAQATVVERLQSGGDATVVERVVPRTVADVAVGEPKKKTGMIIAIAAALVVLVAIGVMVMKKRTPSPTEVVTTTTPTETNVTTTAPAPPANAAMLVLPVPNATVVEIKNLDTGTPYNLKNEDIDTPTFFALEPGHYSVKVDRENGETYEKEVNLAAKSSERLEWDTTPDVDGVASEIMSQTAERTQ